MKTTIYMVRHAESPYIFGQEQTRGLSEEGLAAARKVADILEGMEVDYIISSNYARAVQTVQNLAERKGLPVIEYEQLRERAIKGLEYEAEWEDLVKAIEKSFVDPDFALEGGETTRETQQRAIPIIKKLLKEHRGKNIVIGTHGNIMTIIMNYYNKDFGFDFWNRTSKPDIYKMTFSDNQLDSVEKIWD
ncbi:histidine phosphatase family protein [Paenibacillus sp. J2TS4]|uniref:histidine phosphatase family protein n=1 Tax=Paenibacillus sp. J2TS4 TaxID=2807194 RepID=UPI001B1D13E1|nr:histidine phosphatase family protein [Paenibacillus sp. J2TS4]GIP32774.1 phosphoglycerate mutase [Paenibacillus sp. J2TS4]